MRKFLNALTLRWVVWLNRPSKAERLQCEKNIRDLKEWAEQIRRES